MNGEVLQNYVNGKWIESKVEKTRDVINPATGEVLAKTPMSTKEDTIETIKVANEAFGVGEVLLLNLE